MGQFLYSQREKLNLLLDINRTQRQTGKLRKQLAAARVQQFELDAFGRHGREDERPA